MVNIKDNNRPDVPNVIEKCYHTGTTVLMIWEDNINTAITITIPKDEAIIEHLEITYQNGKVKNAVKKCENPIGLESEIYLVLSVVVSQKLKIKKWWLRSYIK